MEILFRHLRCKHLRYKYLKCLILKFCHFLVSSVLLAILISTGSFVAFADSRDRILGDTQNMFGSSIALHKRDPINSSMRTLQKDYEFVFFYSTTCSHCTEFAPILRSYSDDVGISVKAFVIGAKPSPYFPNSTVVAQGVVNQFFGKESNIAVPTLFILNKNNLHVYPVSSGSLTYPELTARMSELAPKILQHEGNEINGINRKNVDSIKNGIRDKNA